MNRHKSLGITFFALIALFLIPACHHSQQSDVSEDPMQVTTAFLLSLKSQQVDQAKAMLASWDNVPTRLMAGAIEDLNDIAKYLSSGRGLLIPVEAITLNDAAVVAVDERRGSSPDRPRGIDPVFLIRQAGQWRIFPNPTRFDQWPVLSAEETADFQVLDDWVDTNKKQLLEQSAQIDLSPWLVQPSGD